MLHVNGLTYRIQGRILFDQATVHIPAGHKVGLVGRNGSGKSTLFKLITGELPIDDGAISVRKDARVGQVAQDAPKGPESLLDTVLAADLERASLMKEAETATDPHRIADIHTRLADIDAHAAEARAAQILAGLGFDDAAQQRPCSDFSGGWQMRVALAAALFARPDLLLLDEPTNHLDLEAVLWLQSYLESWTGTLLVISHERDLLNAVCSEIVHLSGTKLNRYVGGYDDFERIRREKFTLQAKLQTKQLAERRRIQAFVDRFRAKATKARQAQSRLKMLARMEPIASVVEERTITFDFPNPDPLSPPLIAMEDVAIGYEPDKPVLTGLDLRIDMDDRIALLGANGNGKSTLMRLLADRLKPLSGRLRKSSKLQVGYFAQHQTEELAPVRTPYEHMAELLPMATETKVRAHLGQFGFSGDHADTPVEKLSGGEKARLLFALMSRNQPHLMLLDEPTNHLDVDARQALIQAMNAYDGAIILVSHDPHLIELACDRLWLVGGGRARPFEGDLDDYRQVLLEARRGTKRDGKSNGTDQRKEARRERAKRREELAPLRKAAQQAEKKIDQLTTRRGNLEEQLADPKLYDGASDKVTALQKELAAVLADLEAAEAQWLEASEALEAEEEA